MHSGRISYNGKIAPVWNRTNFDAESYDITNFPGTDIVSIYHYFGDIWILGKKTQGNIFFILSEPIMKLIT